MPGGTHEAQNAVPLLERAGHLRALRGYLDAATEGQGQLVLLGGEAGVGKTSLVREFCRQAAKRTTVLPGSCDALSTPQPLGPLIDIAEVAGEPLSRLLDEATSQHERFRTFHHWLSSGRRPSLVIFEDVHWADEATLDLLRFLGRRIESTRALLVATYRDDEVGPRHPLRVVIGDLATARGTHRLSLSPLTAEAVAVLAEGSELDPLELHRKTGGNPFFVTEVLASGADGIPPSVRDTVLARAARLSPPARATLDAAAVIGARIEPWLLTEVLGPTTNAVEECVALGILRAEGRVFTFRHEIGREALLDALPLWSKLDLHRRVLAALEAATPTPEQLARLAHHAEEAGDAGAVLNYAPAAARRAVSLSAHRQAAAQYARALRFAGALPPDERALLLEQYARECRIVDLSDEAIEAYEQALEIRRAAGDRPREGQLLDWLGGILVGMGRNSEAEEASRAAIAILESLPPGPELAMAYRTQAHLRMLDRDSAEALAWGEKAMQLAEQLQDDMLRIGIYSTMGAAMLVADDDGGRVLLERTLEMARQAGSEYDVALCYGNLGSALGEFHRFAAADRYLADGIAYTRERDLDAQQLYMLAWQALSHLHQGRWAQATDAALAVLRRPGVSAISRIMALVALGRVRARRGDPEVAATLDEALELASQTATLQRLAPVRAARAEAAWLRGDGDLTGYEARAAFDLALDKRHPWFIGELAYWRWKAGDLDGPPAPAAEPYALQMAGDWGAAAERWRALNCPYEAARALTESNDEEAVRRAFEEFDRLDAAPARAEAAQRLRELGAASIPRGARPSTQANPAGMTNRQVEVARLLAEGHSNATIAGRLFISAKTVEHHVSAIFAKLEVDNRLDAIREIERLGLDSRE